MPRIDFPVWTLGDEQNGFRVVGVKRPKPICPQGSKLAVIVGYMSNVTGDYEELDVYVTDVWNNADGELCVLLNEPIYGKILTLKFHCIPKRSGAPDIGEPANNIKQTNYHENQPDVATELIASFGVEDTCCCEECE